MRQNFELGYLTLSIQLTLCWRLFQVSNVATVQIILQYFLSFFYHFSFWWWPGSWMRRKWGRMKRRRMRRRLAAKKRPIRGRPTRNIQTNGPLTTKVSTQQPNGPMLRNRCRRRLWSSARSIKWRLEPNQNHRPSQESNSRWLRVPAAVWPFWWPQPTVCSCSSPPTETTTRWPAWRTGTFASDPRADCRPPSGCSFIRSVTSATPLKVSLPISDSDKFAGCA